MRSAALSTDGRYRYCLHRVLGPGRPMTFIMLNPSIADAHVDDPTIRRCLGFARREGCGVLAVVNLFPLRATNPKALSVPDPGFAAASSVNADYVREEFRNAAHHDGIVVAAWGASAPASLPRPDVEKMARDAGISLHCLGRTRQGHPRHPLYVRADQPLEVYA